MIPAAELRDRCRAELAQLLGPNYRHYKSYRHFRASFEGGTEYLEIVVATHGRCQHLAFRFGTRVDALQQCVSKAMNETEPNVHHVSSISSYSVNIGPTSPHWPYPIRGAWWIESELDFDRALRQIRAFVFDLILPFLATHHTSEAIRETLLERPGRSTIHRPYVQILAASLLAGNYPRFLSDIDQLESQYIAFRPGYLSDFIKARDKLSKCVQIGA
jgi:hypothetical protein